MLLVPPDWMLAFADVPGAMEAEGKPGVEAVRALRGMQAGATPWVCRGGVCRVRPVADSSRAWLSPV